MDSFDALYIIPESQIGPSLDVSRETAKAVVRDLVARGKVKVKRSPTGRNRLTFRGFQRVAEEILRAA